MPKLTDTQLVILSAAAARIDHATLPLPDTLKARGGAATASLKSLLKKGLIEEHRVRAKQLAWREEDDRRWGLRITPSGLEALGIDPEGDGPKEAQKPRSAAERSRQAGKGRRAAKPADSTNSKRQMLVEMLSRPKGAKAPDLQNALGWLPHTVRAAITGLRKQGHIIDRCRGEDGVSVYRVVGRTDAVAEAEANA